MAKRLTDARLIARDMARMLERKSTPQPKVLSQAEINRRDFDEIKRQHESEFIDERVPLTEYERSLPTTPFGMTHKTVSVRRSEVEKRDAPIKALVAQQNTLLQESRRVHAQALLNLSDDPWLASHCAAATRVPTAPLVAAAFGEWRDDFHINGFTEVTDAGIALLAQVSERNVRIDWTLAETFRMVWELLDTLGLVQNGIHYKAKEQEAEPEAAVMVRPEVPEAPATREACEQAYAEQALPLFQQWRTSLLENWSLVLTKEMENAAIEYLRRNNLSPLVPANYDKARVSLVVRGIIPRMDNGGLRLLRDEELCMALEKVDLSSTEGRQWYLRQHDKFSNAPVD